MMTRPSCTRLDPAERGPADEAPDRRKNEKIAEMGLGARAGDGVELATGARAHGPLTGSARWDTADERKGGGWPRVSLRARRQGQRSNGRVSHNPIEFKSLRVSASLLSAFSRSIPSFRPLPLFGSQQGECMPELAGRDAHAVDARRRLLARPTHQAASKQWRLQVGQLADAASLF